MMLSKKYFCAIAAAAIMAMPFFGSATAWAEEEADQTLVEGYTVEDEGFTSVVTWTKNGDMNIYGKFYYPEGFDESQTYPTVIMSHGLGFKAEMVERAQWPQAVVKEGFVVYAFDYCGGGRNSNSDGAAALTNVGRWHFTMALNRPLPSSFACKNESLRNVPNYSLVEVSRLYWYNKTDFSRRGADNLVC